MSRKFTVTQDTKSNSWMIAFSYRDAEGNTQRYRKTAGKGATRKKAERQAADLVRLHDRDKRLFVDEFVTPKPKIQPVAFSGLARRWLDEHLMVKLRVTTRRTHEQILRVNLVPYFGDRDARGITRADVSSYVAAKVAAGLSPKSVNNHLSVLRSLFDFARETLALLAENPLVGVETLTVGDQGTAFLNAEEGERYLAAVAARDPASHAILATALRAGLRQGELCALRWFDVDLTRGALIVARSRFRDTEGPTKGNRVRRVPISPQLSAVLTGHRTPDARPAPLNAVQQLLGHADLKVTLRYAHLAPDTLSNWVARLDAPVAPLVAIDGGRAAGAAA